MLNTDGTTLLLPAPGKAVRAVLLPGQAVMLPGKTALLLGLLLGKHNTQQGGASC